MDILSFDNSVTTRNEDSRDTPYIDPQGLCCGVRGDSISIPVVNFCPERDEPEAPPVVTDSHRDGAGYFITIAHAHGSTFFAHANPDKEFCAYATAHSGVSEEQ